MMPTAAEPVTVKNGVVYVGKNEALNFETGEPIRVPSGASSEQIKQAIRDGGAISKRQHFYGGEVASEAPAAEAKAPPTPEQARAELQRQVIDLRKRKSVLESLRACLGG